jgi:hypothetical protein
LFGYAVFSVKIAHYCQTFKKEELTMADRADMAFIGKQSQTHCFLLNGVPGNHTFKAAELTYEVFDAGNGETVHRLVHHKDIEPTNELKTQVLLALAEAAKGSKN